MYYKDLETDPKAMRDYVAAQKAVASKRLNPTKQPKGK
jgi:hypothetical protein